MSVLRLIFRLPVVLLVLVLAPWASMLGNLFTRKGSLERYHWRCRVMRLGARVLFRACGGRLKVAGAPPAHPFILTANHLGYVDIIAMSSVVPGYYISKKEVRDWPLVGFMTRWINVLFVDRENPRDLPRLNEVIAGTIDAGMGVVFYPEGTSSSGETVLPFMPSLLAVPVEKDFPVHYASISYHTPYGERHPREAVCWWGEMEFFPHLLAMIRMKTFHATITFGSDSLKNSNRKMLANELRSAVLSNFKPVGNQETLCITR